MRFENDYVEGKVIEYYQNGNIKEEIEYLGGERNGWRIEYNETGEIINKTYYRDGTIY